MGCLIVSSINYVVSHLLALLVFYLYDMADPSCFCSIFLLSPRVDISSCHHMN